ncbi:hypothetical protein EJ02DRAFT_489835 [Clathrospora elynae]|uniref:Uncharacterized protein n=1 Tax=Clathrospora elynae TaxID=706981 RepID=A0A6A5S463_9PLEO|nr:hypothetical protein EJ02DRAFT_489835 [Clathrospora elynae]
MAVEELMADSIERDPTEAPLLQDLSRHESPLQTLSRKRSASSSATASVRSHKKPTTEQLGRELGGLTEQLRALVGVMDKDYQWDALQAFFKVYEIIHSALKLAIVDAFGSEYLAKDFVMMRGKLRQNWVKTELLRRKVAIQSGGFSSEEFDAEMERIDWGGDGDLALKTVVEEVDEMENLVGLPKAGYNRMRFSPALGREPQWSWDITIELQGASMELGCKPAAMIAT